MTKRISILVAMEDVSFRKTICGGLTRVGFDVYEAGDSEDIKEVFNKSLIHCLIFDSNISDKSIITQQWSKYPTIALMRNVNTSDFLSIYDPPSHEYETIPVDIDRIIDLIYKISRV